MDKPSFERKRVIYELPTAALFGALGVGLPVAFHAVGLGKYFMPMHIPILAVGFLVSPLLAALTGLVTPLLSALLTGMPPLVPPIAAMMSVELGVKATMASLLYRRTKRFYLSLLTAILVARLVWVLQVWAMAPLLHLPEALTLAAALADTIKGAPGILLQVVAVPVLVKGVEKARMRT